MHKDWHKDEFLQSDDEIAIKVMIEASTFLSVVTTGKVIEETSECSERPSFALLSGFVQDRQRKEDKQAWRDHRLHPERVLREQETLLRHRCTQAQLFHSEHEHWRVAGRHESHLWSQQTAESSRCENTEQLFVISSYPHQTWNLWRSTMSESASSQRSSETGDKACGAWRSQRTATSRRYPTKSEVFFQ